MRNLRQQGDESALEAGLKKLLVPVTESANTLNTLQGQMKLLRQPRRRFMTGLVALVLVTGFSCTAGTSRVDKTDAGAGASLPSRFTTPTDPEGGEEPIGTAATKSTVADEANSVGAVRTIKRVDVAVGWVVTDGALLRTDDGGATWSKNVLPRSNSRPGHALLDGDHAWVATVSPDGEQVTVSRTEDGGRNFPSSTLPEKFDNPPSPVLSFVDPRHGFLAITTLPRKERGRLYSTGDGGRTWALVNPDVPSAGVTFWSRQDGWASGQGLFRTSDGGRTWSRVRPPGWDAQGIIDGGPIFKLIRARGPEAIIESYLPTGMLGHRTLLATTNAGRSWRDTLPIEVAEVAGTGPQPAIAVVGESRFGVLTGGAQSLLLSDDGGRSYRTRPSGLRRIDRPLLSFASPDLAWAADPSGGCAEPTSSCERIFGTDDGGRTWNPLKLPRT